MAIGKDDDSLHVGTVQDLLSHLGVAAAQRHGGTDDVEMFDDQGAVLEVGRDASGQRRLVPGAQPAVSGQLLVDRIAVVLARAQVGLHRDPDPNGELTRFPVLQGDLRTVLAALADFLGPLVRPGPTPQVAPLITATRLICVATTRSGPVGPTR